MPATPTAPATLPTALPPSRRRRSLRARLAALPTLACLALLAALPLPRAQAQDDWRDCAAEGQTCRINGESMVRFGTEGRHVFRVARESLPCTVESFGSDPVPGRVKRCEVSSDWRSDPRYRGWRHGGMGQAADEPWRFCASEGGSCTVNGRAQMRFGIDGRFATREVSGRVGCDVGTFGDPAPGRVKICQLADQGRWALCANEGELCRLPYPTQVRYGAMGHYAELAGSGSVACHNGQFGDPMPGMAKQCEYRLGAAPVGPGGMAGPSRPGPVVGLPWSFCAREGASCSFRGAAMLRYGANGRFAYREAQDGLLCSNEEFGLDPAPGSPKQCELLRPGR